MNIASIFDQDAASRLLDSSKVLNQFYAALTRSVRLSIYLPLDFILAHMVLLSNRWVS